MQWVDTQLNPKTEAPAALDVVAYNNGGDVLRWTRCGRSPYAPLTARLRAVDDAGLGPLHLDASWIEDSFDPEVLRTIECDQHYYALPVGLHQVNTLFYNKRLLRAAGFDVDQNGSGERALPDSLDELEAAASVNWTLSLFFIENIMLASAGAERYERYWSGQECDASLYGVSGHARAVRVHGGRVCPAGHADQRRRERARLVARGDRARHPARVRRAQARALRASRRPPAAGARPAGAIPAGVLAGNGARCAQRPSGGVSGAFGTAAGLARRALPSGPRLAQTGGREGIYSLVW